MLLFDTDVLVDYLRGQPQAIALLESSAAETLAVSAITVAELHAGARDDEKAALADFLRVFTLVTVDENMARRGGELRRQYRASHGTGLADALIAASALGLGARLLTLNVRHYPMFPGLKPAYTK